MSPVRATVLQLSLDLQLRTLQLSRYARSANGHRQLHARRRVRGWRPLHWSPRRAWRQPPPANRAWLLLSPCCARPCCSPRPARPQPWPVSPLRTPPTRASSCRSAGSAPACVAGVSLSLRTLLLPARLPGRESHPPLTPLTLQGYGNGKEQPLGVYPECWTDGHPDASGRVPHPGIDCSAQVTNATLTWLKSGGRRIDHGDSYEDMPSGKHTSNPHHTGASQEPSERLSVVTVGAGMAASGVDRKEIFLTTKIGDGVSDFLRFSSSCSTYTLFHSNSTQFLLRLSGIGSGGEGRRKSAQPPTYPTTT